MGVKSVTLEAKSDESFNNLVEKKINEIGWENVLSISISTCRMQEVVKSGRGMMDFILYTANVIYKTPDK